MVSHSTTLELYYDASWHLVPIYARGGCTIQRGTTNPSSDSEPASAAVLIDNRSGYYSPRSIASPLFGKIGQNTRARITVDGDIRIVGEVASWKPERAVKGDAWTSIQIAGVLQRIGRGTDPLQSLARRYFQRDQGIEGSYIQLPFAYWPLEDGPGSEGAENAVSKVAPLGSTTVRGGKPLVPAASTLAKFGTVTDTFPGSDRQPDYSLGMRLEADTPGMSSTGSWAVQWVQRSPSSADHDTVEDFPPGIKVLTAGTSTYLTVSFYQDPSISISWGNVGGGLDNLTVFNNGFDDQWHTYRVEFIQGVGTAYTVDFYIDGDLANSHVGLGAITVGQPTHITVNHNNSKFLGSLGHLMIWDDVTSIPDEWIIFQGKIGEYADTRFNRLCREESITPTVVGFWTVKMGPQLVTTLLEQFDEIARTDDADIFETRDDFGLTMRCCDSKMNQAPDFTINYLGQIATNLTPIFGDEGIRNDVVATRPGGGSRRVQQLVGPRNIELPENDPDGVGPYRTQINVNPETDDGLADNAGWRVNLGTFDGTWYAEITADLDAAPAIAASVTALDIGDLLAINNLPVDEALQTVESIIIGIKEEVGTHRRLITFYTVPAEPYKVGVLSSTSGDTGAFLGHLDPDVTKSTNTSTIAVAATSFSVTTSSGPLWTTTADDFPLDVIVGGQQISISSITGGSSPQTFNVRSAALGGLQVRYAIPSGMNVVPQLPIILTMQED